MNVEVVCLATAPKQYRCKLRRASDDAEAEFDQNDKEGIAAFLAPDNGEGFLVSFTVTQLDMPVVYAAPSKEQQPRLQT